MLFLTSLIYSALLYILLGFLVLDFISVKINSFVPIGAEFWFFITSFVAYFIILIVVKSQMLHLQKWSRRYQGRDFLMKQIFDTSRYRWINVIGFAVICLATATLIFHTDSSQGTVRQMKSWGDNLPYQMWPLILACTVGLYSGIKQKSIPIALSSELPDSRFSGEAAELDEDEASINDIEVSWNPNLSSVNKVIKQTFKVSVHEFDSAKDLPRPDLNSGKSREFIINGCCSSIDGMATKLRQISEQYNLTEDEEVENVIAMAKSLITESDTAERLRYPIETLNDKQATSSDYVIFVCSLLYLLGHNVALVVLPTEKEELLGLGYSGPIKNRELSIVSESGDEYNLLSISQPGDNKSELFINMLMSLDKAVAWPI